MLFPGGGEIREFQAPDQTMGTFLMEFDLLRGRAEARKAIVSILCVRNAALSKNEKSLALASIRYSLAPPEASSRLRR